MIRDVSRLCDEEFDLVIVGGGVLGAFLAHESARRGYRTALLEAGDFAGGTTAASGKVLHGGLRYLQHLQIGLAAASNREQRRIAELAPRLVRPLPFIVPVRKGDLRESMTMRAGAWGWNAARRFLPGDDGLPGSEFVGETELTRMLGEPWAPVLSGGMRFHDYQLRSPERLTVALLDDASEHGAEIVNYLEAVGTERTGDRVTGVSAFDHLANRRLTVQGRMTVNATGPRGAAIANEVDGSLAKTAFAKGTHVVLDRPEPPAALALPFQAEDAGSVLGRERRVFLMPWEGKTLLGASYTSFDPQLDEVQPDGREVRDFLASVHRQWPELALDGTSPLHAYAGLYPIFGAGGTPSDDSFQASRRPRIVDHADSGGPAGIVSAVSVKLTGAWKLAEQVLEVVADTLGAPNTEVPDDDHRELSRAHPTPLASQSPPSGLNFRECEMDELTEMIDAAVHEEMAVTLPDFLFRRTWLGHLGCPDDALLEPLGRAMGDCLGWDERRVRAEVARTRDEYMPIKEAIARNSDAGHD